MIRAKLSLTLTDMETDQMAEDYIEVSAGTIEILKPLLLRTTLLAFAETVQNTLNGPNWKAGPQAHEPKASAKKAVRKKPAAAAKKKRP